MTKNTSLSFSDFLSFFPHIELPVILSDQGITTFSATNKPFSVEAIEDFILQWETEADDLTEFIPCFKIPDTKDFDAIVYWKGSLLKYEYILLTFDKKHNLINRRIISSVLSDGVSIKKSIAKIDEDWIIHIMAGENHKDEPNYDSSKSRAFSMEIQANGEVIFSLQD